MTKKKHYLVETIPAGPKAAKEAEQARTRLLAQVDEKRNPRTRATVNRLMDRYLEVLDVEPTTRSTYEGYIRNHIRPLLGDLAVGRLDGEVLDSFYAQLRACRAHCRGRRYVEHRTPEEHECTERCPDGSTWHKPDSIGQRYVRMCARLGWDMNIHQLRHYSATELIAAGVDVRTIAGRLGHSGGGSTTLRVYSAWLSEADQRAAGTLADRMPALPAGVATADVMESGAVTPAADEGNASPYQRIAADLHAAIKCGALAPGQPLPPVAELADRYDVAVGTAHRAIAQLREAGLITVSRGKRAVVATG